MRFAVPTWFRAAFAMFGIGWGANQFAPMAGVYEAQAQVPAATFALLFGLYAAGLIPALLATGWLSDRRGRRWVMLRTVGISAAATVLLIVDPGGVPWLGAGRLLAGIASGAAFVAGSAWVNELSAGTAGAGPRRSAIALSAGFGLGPLVSGAVAQWLPAPMVLPYIAHLILLVPAVPLVFGCPETAGGARAAARRLIPAVVWTRPFLLGVVPWAPWVFGAATTSFVTAARLAARGAGSVPIAFSGAVAAMTLLTGVLVQPYARRLGRGGAVRLPVTGLVLIAVGLVLTAWLASGGTGHRVVLMVPVALLLGAAYGILLVAGLLAVERLASPSELASAIAVFYVLIYLGFAAPYLLSLLSGGTNFVPWLLAGAVIALLTIPAAVAAAAAEPRAAVTVDVEREYR